MSKEIPPLPETALVHNKIMPYRVPLFERLIDDHDIDIFLFDGSIPSSFRYPDGVNVVDKLELVRCLWNGEYDVVVNPDVVFSEAHLDGIVGSMQTVNVVQWTETWAIPGRNRRQRFRTASLLRIADLYADEWVVPGTASASYVERITGSPSDSIHQIGGPTHIDCENDIPVTALPEDAEEAIQSDDPVVLFLGQVIRRKGVDTLIDAVALLEDDVDCHLLLGGGGDEKYKQSLGRQIKCAELDNVCFLGWIPEEQLSTLYANADVYVLPSRADPWGVSVVEAMQAGTPVVVSEAVGAAWDLVDGQETGYVVPVDEPEALANRLRLLLTDADTRTEMGERAAKLVQTEATYDRMLTRMCAAIRRADDRYPVTSESGSDRTPS